jgi:DNA-binding NarL/FixJ family response regulator
MKVRKKILIVEDEPMIAHDIKEHLDEGDYEVVGIAYNGKSAQHKLTHLDVDAAILDIRLKGEISGIEVAHFINAQVHIPFIFLTSHSDETTLSEAKQTRPGGYLLKPFDKQSIYTTLEVALFNHEEPDLPALDMLNQMLPTALSDREYQLLTQLKKGGTNQEIANSLGITLNTVKSHLYHAFTKLDASNRTDALYRLEQLAHGKGPLSKDN